MEAWIHIIGSISCFITGYFIGKLLFNKFVNKNYFSIGKNESLIIIISNVITVAYYFWYYFFVPVV